MCSLLPAYSSSAEILTRQVMLLEVRIFNQVIRSPTGRLLVSGISPFACCVRHQSLGGSEILGKSLVQMSEGLESGKLLPASKMVPVSPAPKG